MEQEFVCQLIKIWPLEFFQQLSHGGCVPRNVHQVMGLAVKPWSHLEFPFSFGNVASLGKDNLLIGELHLKKYFPPLKRSPPSLEEKVSWGLEARITLTVPCTRRSLEAASE